MIRLIDKLKALGIWFWYLIIGLSVVAVLMNSIIGLFGNVAGPIVVLVIVVFTWWVYFKHDWGTNNEKK